jgi:hypothetical protein
MKHGEERNRRIETTYGKSETMVTANGHELTMPMSSMTQTVSERWCETCNEWVEAKGIIGAILCVKCNNGKSFDL